MRQTITRGALGLSIIAAALAVAAPANADQHRLKNRDFTNGTFYLGIPPGPQNGHVPANVGLIVWQYGQDDQIWNVPAGGGLFSDLYTDPYSNSVCIGVEGGLGAGNGARIIDQPCDWSQTVHPEQYWQMIPSSSVGLGSQYPNCFIMWNVYNSKAMGVTNGDVQNGGTVIQWDYDGSANQFWCLE